MGGSVIAPGLSQKFNGKRPHKRDGLRDVSICSVPVCEFSLAESLTMHAVQSSGRDIQPARSFCDTLHHCMYSRKRDSAQSALRRSSLFLHLHGSQIGSGHILRPLLCLSIPCPRVRPSFNLGTLISVVMPKMPWIRGGYAPGHPIFCLFRACWRPLDLLYFSTLR